MTHKQKTDIAITRNKYFDVTFTSDIMSVIRVYNKVTNNYTYLLHGAESFLRS